jgi:ubiquitin-protein ligase
MAAAARTALRRLVKDLKEIEKEPVDGANLMPVGDGDDLFTLHGNLIIPEGPYEGLLVHFIIRVSDSYPISAPSGRVGFDYPFNDLHHGHLHGGKMCNDYLSDFQGYFDAIDGGQRKSASGWSSGVTLAKLLLVLKHFLADTDCPPPSPFTVDKVFADVKGYVCHECGHTYASPYPPLPKAAIDSKEEEEEEVSEEKKVDRLKVAVQRARELLVCSALQENYIDSPDLLLGYPILLQKDRRNRLWTTLIPELSSYDHYIHQIQQHGAEKLDNFLSVFLRTASGHQYTNWLPIYLNEDHFQKNSQCILNALSVSPMELKEHLRMSFSHIWSFVCCLAS